MKIVKTLLMFAIATMAFPVSEAAAEKCNGYTNLLRSNFRSPSTRSRCARRARRRPGDRRRAGVRRGAVRGRGGFRKASNTRMLST